MSTLYRKVLCSERLPDDNNYHDTNDGVIYYWKGLLCNQNGPLTFTPEWWLEEVTIPDEEYVENFIIELQKHFKMKFDVEVWKSGFKTALELLTGGK